MMRLEWIEDILAVLDTGSQTAAAEKRFLTQSAFTRRMRTIEESLGTALFDRSKKPVKLLPHIISQENEMRSIVSKLNILRNRLVDPAEFTNNNVSFACQHTIATTISPSLIRKLTRDRKLNVKVRASNRDTCLMMLLTSEVEFALIFQSIDDALAKDKSVFLEENLGSDWMIPVMAKEFEIEILKNLEIGNLPIICYPRESFLGKLYEVAFIQKLTTDYQINLTAETGLTLAALQYALEGIGIGWVPKSIATPYLKQGQLIDLSDKLPKQEMQAKIIRLQDQMSELGEEVWNQITTEYRRTNHSN